MGLDFIFSLPPWRELEKAINAGQTKVQLSGIAEAAKPFILAGLAAKIERPIVLILPQNKDLSPLAEGVEFYLPFFALSKSSFLLPPLVENPYHGVPPSLEAVSTRMRLFYRLGQEKPKIIVTNLPGLLKPVPAISCWQDLFLEIELDLPLEKDYLLYRLREFGYHEVDLIASPGEIASRGGIIDVFSPWASHPFRLELGADGVVSIREFDVSTQRSRSKLDAAVIPALIEFPPGGEFMETWAERAKRRWPFEWKSQEFLNLADIKNDGLFAFLAPLVSEKFQSLLDLIPEPLVILDDPEEVEREWKEWLEELKKDFAQAQEENVPALSPEEIFSPSELEAIKNRAMVIQDFNREDQRQAISFSFQPAPYFHNRIPFFLDYLKKLQEERDQSYLFLSQAGLKERMLSLMEEKGILARPSADIRDKPKEGEVIVWSGKLDHGFTYPPYKLHLFGERDILTEERVLVSRPARRPFTSYFQDLKAGDYVVHNDYGIGLFTGLIRLQVDGVNREFMEILYRDGDKLYVPVEDLKLVQRYTPVGPNLPILDKLGTQSWEKTKEKTRKAVEKLAKDLLALYARRKATLGHSFSHGGLWEDEFDKTFPYEETEDQLRSIQEVKKDMESPAPMDRLLCGDVGYGKTEVAMRAAFKAVMDGKQVAVLCPTTVLASQHLKTFRQRMSLFPVRIEPLTRLQTKDQQAKVLADLKRGLVDIIIGTHRLLSKDVEFHDLGLLVVDEEQRFGVRQKEKIKNLKASVDVLTMTATPIPRTLNMSFSGLRDISLIETAPRDRLAVHTVVSVFNPKLITSAIRQELSRGGQVYYVHNQIEDIDRVASLISQLVPEARPVIVHGQMASNQLERRMVDFINQRYNVLVATTIIENGIDIPLVNTLIVDRADRYGLSQLYQLRGRVGRSSRQAYAYFLVPPGHELTPQARERLKALKEFSELGSGFRLAARDLEIRGAGNLLGPQQHGLMEAVGFDYFMQLLDKAILELKGEAVEEAKCEINLRLDLRIPEEYIPQMNLRLNFYKRVSSLESLEEMGQLSQEMEDRFGPLPPSVQNLIVYGGIKYLAEKLKLKSLDRVGKKIILSWSPTTPAKLEKFLDLLKRRRGSLTPQGVVTIPLTTEEESAVRSETLGMLKELLE